MEQKTVEELLPWLLQAEDDMAGADTQGDAADLSPAKSAEIDRVNTEKYKQAALADGYGRGFFIAEGQCKCVSAVPDLPAERFESLSRELQRITMTSNADALKFMRDTVNASYIYGNDGYMNRSVRALGATPARKFSTEKLRVALVVGQGNFESMAPELLNHAHMVLFVDIDRNVLNHNLFMAAVLQSNEDFIPAYLDEKRNPVLVDHIRQGPLSVYQPMSGQQIARLEVKEYTPTDLSATLFNKNASSFAEFSILGAKLRKYIKGETTLAQGRPLFDKKDLAEFEKFREVMSSDDDFKPWLSRYDELYKGLKKLISKKNMKFSVEQAQQLKNMVDAVVDNRFFIAKDQRFALCRAASRELRFASIQLNLFDQDQVAQLKAVFEANDVVVSFANLTNLYYYDQDKLFAPHARAEEPWAPKGNLVKSLKALCDPAQTLFFFSTYDKPGAQTLSSQYCEGLINYVGAMARNIKSLNEKMVGTREMLQFRERQHQRTEAAANIKESESTLSADHKK